MRKIAVVTGTRAEYGLLFWLMKEIKKDKNLQLQVIVTGMHLSPEFGLTYKEIEKDFKIDKKIEMLLSSDTPVGISKSMGLAQISFSEAYQDLKPDILVVLGDRYEIFSAVASAMISNIPIAHLHGGEITEGAFDDAIRHSITKISHLHFVANKEYKNRVIQLGENPKKVFNVGGLGLDNINKLTLLSKKEFEKSINFKLKKRNFIITFHPVTLANNSQEQFQNLLDVLDKFKCVGLIFTKANSDTDGRIINKMIDSFVNTRKKKSISFNSLGQLRYLSALQYIDAMVGNSSSGLVESPSFKIGTINIGNRQNGRLKAKSVIDCKPIKNNISKAFEKLFSKSFQHSLASVKNPYGTGGASLKIVKILKQYPLGNILYKEFFNIRKVQNCK